MTVFAGAVIFASDSNNALVMIRKSADEVAPVSSIALQDDNELFVAVLANSIYFVSGWFMYSAVSNVPDLRINYAFPASATFTRTDWGVPSTNTTPADSIDTTAATTADNGRGAGTTVKSLYMQGELVVGATAGTFKVQFAQVTSSVDAVTMKAGSRLILQKFA